MRYLSMVICICVASFVGAIVLSSTCMAFEIISDADAAKVQGSWMINTLCDGIDDGCTGDSDCFLFGEYGWVKWWMMEHKVCHSNSTTKDCFKQMVLCRILVQYPTGIECSSAGTYAGYQIVSRVNEIGCYFDGPPPH